MSALTAASLLNALEGVGYFVDRRGIIVAVGAPHWDDFAQANAASALTASAVIGRSLFDFISGDEVRNSFALFMETL